MAENLAGSAEILLGREDGLNRLDLTPAGFSHSFLGLAMAIVIEAGTTALGYSHQLSGADTAALPSKPVFVLASLAILLICYGVSLLVIYLLCRDAKTRARFPVAIIAHNWASAVIGAVLFIPVSLLLISTGRGGEDGAETAAALLFFAIIGVTIVAGIRLVRISLGVPHPVAVGMFAASFLTSLLAQGWLSRLLGV